MNFRIFKDNLSKYFGFGTKKEMIDLHLESNYKSEINELNYLIAQRNVTLGTLRSLIHTYEKILNSNKKILDLCNAIFDEVEEEIKNEYSRIKINLCDRNNKILMSENLSTLKNAVMLLQMQDLTFYIKQLEILPLIYQVLDNIITNKGFYVIDDNLEDFREIYFKYLQINQLMKSESILDIKGSPILLEETGLNMLLSLFTICKKYAYDLEIFLQKFYISEKKLCSLNEKDKFLLQEIENAKNIIHTSKVYVQAQASHNYLEQIDKSR